MSKIILRLLLSALILVSPLAFSSDDIVSQKNAGWLADYAAMRQLEELANTAFEAENWQLAAEYYERASNFAQAVPGPLGMWIDYRVMQSYAKSKDLDRLNTIVKSAAVRGFRFPNYIENNPDFIFAKQSKSFQSSLAQIKLSANVYRNSRLHPQDAKLIFDDVPRFWAAYDLAADKKRASQKAAVFRQHYLGSGSAGLIEYHWIKTKSMEYLVKKIEASQAYYDGIRSETLRAAAYEPQIREGFKRLKNLYPDAYFPDVSFVVGRLNSGGTAGPSGMLIGLDVWSWTEGVPVDGISVGFQKILKSSSLARLPYVVIHEHIHSLQAYTDETSLLLSALQEGTADFLALKSLPEASLPPYFVWGAKNEAMIWDKFKQQMHGKDNSQWIANNGSDVGENWHADLGYFVGAQIAEAYYLQADDKQQAIKDLLLINDAKAILNKSGYAEQFE